MNSFLFLSQKKIIKSLPVLKALLWLCNLAAINTYILLRILFTGFSFSASEEVLIILKTFYMGTAIAVALFLLYIVIEITDYVISKNTRPFFVLRTSSLVWLTIITGCIMLFSCNASVSVGIKKDFSTGLIATYKNLEPENVMLVMNNEQLNHTDIPLGQNFVLINDNVKGLVEKNGKVSVGCSLKISDKNGKAILDEHDLFAGNDVYNKKDVNYLKCAVSTGAPMQWNEKYDVAVTFWDKYGDGKIDNTVTVNMIDEP